jgi:hypothetical protein
MPFVGSTTRLLEIRKGAACSAWPQVQDDSLYLPDSSASMNQKQLEGIEALERKLLKVTSVWDTTPTNFISHLHACSCEKITVAS